jgi:hypothetical protein
MKRSALGVALLAVCSFTPVSAEVTDCTVITALPAVIQTRGVWCLKGNLSWTQKTGRAIDVRESFVTIDLNGFLLNGQGAGLDTQATGIYSRDRRGVTVRNGTIRGFYRGVHVDGSAAHGHVLEDLRLDQIRGIGFTVHGYGTAVRNNRVLSTGGSTVSDNGTAVFLSQARGIRVSDNTISGTGGSFSAIGISLQEADLIEIRGNSVLDTVGGETGYAILSNFSANVTIERNRVLNGAALGNFGIVGNGGSGVNCIDNVVARFSTTFAGCTFGSGNLTP